MQTRVSGSGIEAQNNSNLTSVLEECRNHPNLVCQKEQDHSLLHANKKAGNRGSLYEVDPRKSIITSRRPSTNGKYIESPDGDIDSISESSILIGAPYKKATRPNSMADNRHDFPFRSRLRDLWSMSLLTLITTFAGLLFLSFILYSFVNRQLDPKGCRMSYMRPSFVKLSDFDTEHTHFASKYSMYLYREGGIDDDERVKGVPVLFIPGNAGSYKQVRPIAAEGASYFHEVLRYDSAAISAGVRNLDFFTVDFNEDITAFHGRTLLDQAEYLNEAIAYILSLYHDPHRSERDSDLPDPTSVIILGHSMGGIVARTMLVMPNYQTNTINTIITMSAPHARPPVSFDSEIVTTYQRINKYWRDAYSQKWANNNPLWHVTLISIAGGGLDTVVPSDYASLDSLVPETHGFTVFTSTIPRVWIGMDHQAILWCDQFRNIVVRSLYDIIDVNRPAQTKPRADRMRSFKKWYLTGLEKSAEKIFSQNHATTLITLEDKSNYILSQGERLVIRRLGQNQGRRVYLLPISPQGELRENRFTLLTDQKLDKENGSGRVEVLFCSIFGPNPGRSSTLFPVNFMANGMSTTRLACKNSASDVIIIPASTKTSKNPFYLDGEEETEPFSYLQYDLEDIIEHQFVAVIDKASSPTPGWIIAEFSNNKKSQIIYPKSLQNIILFGMELKLPPTHPLVIELKIPALSSSLLSYTLEINYQIPANKNGIFAPILRQYISEPYESKYFVNIQKSDINLHGVSPFIPPPLIKRESHDGLGLQFWTDSMNNSSLSISLKIDFLGSLGKLYMRYRTVFAAFPLLVVALVIRKQFRVYDETGVFISFSASLDLCIRQSLPIVLLALTLLSLSSFKINSFLNLFSSGLWGWKVNETEPQIDFAKNDIFMGSQDPFFWFMIPLIGFICVGVCVMVNYLTLSIISLLAIMHNCLSIQPAWLRNDDRRSIPLIFAPSTLRRRIITTALLFFLVSTFIPYQFAYLVACLVQIATCTKALRIFWDARSNANTNFFNYIYSILILMLWILPINLPILVVWIHNLAVHWLTPFSSHHNLLSVMPFILLVETLTSGRMIPRISSRLRYFTSFLLLCIAVISAVYGMTYAYMLHHLVNFLAGWLVIIHWSSNTAFSLTGIFSIDEIRSIDRSIKRGKTP
ncbi:GPI inositol-deacylase [Erysiphe neolycopersici]|uniref:GPI inositol-deacylase n=1 Tax=Erysiphe neolycopersici TaxID=212602 RepID=A0A420HQL2_9PEZI|nr:GPI inositol-deacylase [Erysiphe neolycopersici]